MLKSPQNLQENQLISASKKSNYIKSQTRGKHSKTKKKISDDDISVVQTSLNMSFYQLLVFKLILMGIF